MSDPEERSAAKNERCPVCDYLIQPGDSVCRLCGTPLPDGVTAPPTTTPPVPPPEMPEPVEERAAPDTAPAAAARLEPESERETPLTTPPEPDALESRLPADATREPESQPDGVEEPQPLPEVVTSMMRERRAPVTTIMALVTLIVTVALGAVVLQASANADMVVNLFPTASPLPPTPTYTPTMTVPPTETPSPTATPTITPTPRPTDTPQPPRFHAVQPNESWFTLALIYGVSAESIATANNRQAGSFLQVDEQVVIPWPTATPPLVPVTVELDGETYIADPGECQTLYEIQSNDSLVSIGAQFNVDYRAILAVNRLSAEAFIRPGDVVCIPEVSFFDPGLSVAPGATPTPGPTQPPPGPQLLYPPDEQRIALADEPVVLQWVAVKDLEPDEWYMVELVNITDITTYPRRGFTRETAFIVPEAWRPPVPEPHRFRWQVSVVKVTGQREDGTFIRTFGGRASQEGRFVWEGAVPTRTPTPTPTVTPTPTS